jgi:hypothetical protein
MHETHDPSVSPSAAVDDGNAAIFVLRFPDARVWYCAVWLAYAAGRNSSHARPEPRGRFEVKTVVQVQTNAKPCLVDNEEFPQPGTEERDQPRIAVREFDACLGLGTLSCVERSARHQEFLAPEPSDPSDPFAQKSLDLGLLSSL